MGLVAGRAVTGLVGSRRANVVVVEIQGRGWIEDVEVLKGRVQEVGRVSRRGGRGEGLAMRREGVSGKA